MPKAKDAGNIVLNESGATLQDVLGAMLRLSPKSVKRVRRKSAPKRKRAKP